MIPIFFLELSFIVLIIFFILNISRIFKYNKIITNHEYIELHITRQSFLEGCLNILYSFDIFFHFEHTASRIVKYNKIVTNHEYIASITHNKTIFF